jgi:hypothetical protein
MLQEAIHRLGYSESIGNKDSLLEPAEVQDMYRSYTRSPRADVIEMIGLYPHWERQVWSCDEVGALDWYLCERPGHVSRVLSQEGRKRTVADVAHAYVQFVDRGEGIPGGWDDIGKVESMIAALGDGMPMAPLIVVPGEKYPNSPECSFVDGVHRSLAYYVYHLRSGNNPEIDMLVGRKAPILKRMVSRVRLR